MAHGEVADIATQRQERAVGHVEHVERAIDQGQADGRDGIHRAHGEARGDDLDDDIHAASGSEIGFENFGARHQLGPLPGPDQLAVIEKRDEGRLVSNTGGVLLHHQDRLAG